MVIVVVVNDNGGSAVAGDFTVTVTGGHPSPASFPVRARSAPAYGSTRAPTP